MTPLFIPGIIFGAFFILNLFVWAKGSSGAVPFGTMLALVLIWFVISVPLSVAGSWLGFKQAVSQLWSSKCPLQLTRSKQSIEGPTKTNQIPRQVPPMAGSLRTIPSILLTGILPFGAIFVELYFIMTSLWTNKIYYMFGFLFLCYGLMIITSAATTVLLVYFLLCAENYRWHWRAFAGAGMTGGYVFVNALIFWATRVSFGGLTGAVLYVGYSALISFIVFILTGTSIPCPPNLPGHFISLFFLDLLADLPLSQVLSVSSPAGPSSIVSMAPLKWTKSFAQASHFVLSQRDLHRLQNGTASLYISTIQYSVLRTVTKYVRCQDFRSGLRLVTAVSRLFCIISLHTVLLFLFLSLQISRYYYIVFVVFYGEYAPCVDFPPPRLSHTSRFYPASIFLTSPSPLSGYPCAWHRSRRIRVL